MLAEAHEQIVVFDPVWLGKLRAERSFSLLRRFGLDIAPAIGNSMDVSVDADPRLVVAKGHDEVGGFAADSVQLEELVNFVRNFALILFEQGAANMANRLGLGLIEAYRINQLLNFFRAQFEHRFGRIREGEQSMRSLGCGRILGAETENTGDQNTKRTPVGFRHQRDNGCLPVWHLPAQNSDYRMNIPIFHDASVLQDDWLD